MKNLSEEELFSRLYKERQEFKISRKDLTEPDYEVWGRARLWFYHQAICLLASFTPIAQSTFDFFTNRKGSASLTYGNFEMDDPDFFESYPLKQQEIEKLVQIEHILNTLLNLSSSSNDTNISSTPSFLLLKCKNNPEIQSLIPKKLAAVVETFGAHPSRNLPDHFSSLELDIDILNELAKKKTWQVMYGSSFTTSVESSEHFDDKELKEDSELHSYRPEKLAKEALRAAAAAIWKKGKLPIPKLLKEPNFKNIANAMANLTGKKEGYTAETITNWIRKLNPDYKPRD
jgi:hypothetical protein